MVDCIHHWVIETPEPGSFEVSPGMCRKCGETASFKNTEPELTRDQLHTLATRVGLGLARAMRGPPDYPEFQGIRRPVEGLASGRLTQAADRIRILQDRLP